MAPLARALAPSVALPRGLLEYLRMNALDEAWYRSELRAAEEIPRFVWLSDFPQWRFLPGGGRHSASESASAEPALAAAADLCREFLRGSGGRRVERARGELWAVPQGRTLSAHALYRTGHMLGIDAASVAAIDALDVHPGHRVLDLCCAPGAKLAVLADTMRRTGALVGVDSCPKRLAECVGLARQRRLAAKPPPSPSAASWSMQLLRHDGTLPLAAASGDAVLWDTALDSVAFGSPNTPLRHWQLGADLRVSVKRPRRRLARAQLRTVDARRAAQDAHWSEFSDLDANFDRVLVDAQCSHEGSLRHVAKCVH